jgi:hypothetical protein
MKANVAIVDDVVAVFLANVAAFNAWQRTMCLQASELNNERMYATVFAFTYQFGHENSKIGRLATCLNNHNAIKNHQKFV